MSSSLEELLRQKKVEQERLAAERPGRLEEWRRACSALIDETCRWLAPLEEKNYLQLKRELIPIREDFLGEYEVPSVRIAFLTGRTLWFRPIGQNVLGAHGRVDIISSGESVVMIVYHGNGKWEFARRESRYGPPQTWPYNQETLEAFLTEFLTD